MNTKMAKMVENRESPRYCAAENETKATVFLKLIASHDSSMEFTSRICKVSI